MDKFNGKLFEKHINDYLSLLVYASLQDLDVDCSTPHSAMLFQSYGNLCKKKEHRSIGVKPRFTLSDGIRQTIMLMFVEEIKELTETTVAKDEAIDSVQKRIITEKYECYTEFISRLAADKSKALGTTLRGAIDATQWFNSQFIGCLPKLSAETVLLAQLSKQFDQFLKVLAWLISQVVWFRGVGGPVTPEVFFAILGQQSMPTVMIISLRDRLRGKKVRITKPVPKKKPIDKPKDAAISSDSQAPHSENTNSAATNVSAQGSIVLPNSSPMPPADNDSVDSLLNDI